MGFCISGSSSNLPFCGGGILWRTRSVPAQQHQSIGKPVRKSARTSSQFRMGRVQGYVRGSVWYLYYHKQGRRHRPRLGPALEIARQRAAQINGQLETGASAALSYRLRYGDHCECSIGFTVAAEVCGKASASVLENAHFHRQLGATFVNDTLSCCFVIKLIIVVSFQVRIHP